MKFSATSLVLAAAVSGAAAHPSGHAHRNAHRSLEARMDFVMNTRPSPPAPPAPKAPTSSQAAPKPSQEAPKPAEKAKPANMQADTVPKNNPKPSGGYKPFCGGNNKRATLAQIAYTGNTGSGGSYACNIMMVDNDIADKYDNTATFINKSGKDQVCKCWLKIGPQGKINGFFAGNEGVTFDLPAGSSKVLAAQDNSQGGCCCGHGSVPLTSIGQFAGTWFEYDWANTSNNDWSGFDASCLVSAAAGVHIPGMSVCNDKTCSTIYEGGAGDNAYVAGMEAVDGTGLNMPKGPAHVKVTIN